MKISEEAWNNYIKKLSTLEDTASSKLRFFMEKFGLPSDEGTMNVFLAYAHSLATTYGEGAAALVCQIYDEIAIASGRTLPPAEPADTATYGEVAKALQGTIKTTQNANYISGVLGRTVKQAGADTMLKNALRDGAQFAWVPNGDTCAFCLTLASRGWQYASKKTIKRGHAEHIHANCDCTYAVRFDNHTTVAGYDPDKYLEIYNEAGGDINEIRRMQYRNNKDTINAEKRAAYAERAKYKYNTKDLKQITTYGKLGVGSVSQDGNTFREELGTINVQKIDTAVEYFLNKIRNETVEHAIVIEKDGKVIHFIGEKDTVGIFDVNLEGAHVLHNHPEGEGITSFGMDDFNYMKEHQNTIYELSNSEYNYYLRVIRPIENLSYHELYIDSMETMRNSDDDKQHIVMTNLAEKGYTRYERRRKN